MIVKLIEGWFPIPDSICAELGIKEGTEAEIEVIDGVIVLTPAPAPPPKK
jgi:antitoxin component of MazEF toxin-antitoxin module